MATAKQKEAARRNLVRARQVQSARRHGATIERSPGLSTAQENRMAERDFAFPKERKEPLVDARHVRNAVARFDQVEGVTDKERDEAWGRIQRAAKRFGVEITADDWRQLAGGKARKNSSMGSARRLAGWFVRRRVKRLIRRAATVLTFAFGVILGAVVSHLFDPDRGHARRARLRDELGGHARRAARGAGGAARRRARYTAGRLEGARHGAMARLRPPEPEPDDALLAQRVRSEVLGRAEFAALGITLDAAAGVVTLRGEVPSGAVAERLAAAVRGVGGVAAVTSMLHEPGTPAPNKRDALEAR